MASAANAFKPDAPSPAVSMRPAKVRLLIVDDDMALRTTMQVILSEEYDVVMAKDGAAAESILYAQSFDILLTDYEMPGRNGLDLLLSVKKNLPNILGILLTAHARKTEIRSINKDRHIFAILSKPFDLEELLRSLRLASAIVRLRMLRSFAGNK